MNTIEKIYSISLCAVRKDKYGDKHKRALMVLEAILTFCIGILLMIFLGLFNLRLTNIWIWAVAYIGIGFLSYKLLNDYFIKSGRFKTIMEITDNYPKRKKRYYAIIAISAYIASAVLLVIGGITMSYLLSLHQ